MRGWVLQNLELVVRNPHNLMILVRNLGEVRDAFSESNLPILVDILDWARIPDSFREEIERVGVVVFSGEVGRQVCQKYDLWYGLCWLRRSSVFDW